MEKEEAIAFCEKLFAKTLQGHALLSNSAHLRGSTQWIRFPRVVCERWVHWLDHRLGGAGGTPVVLMGDAAHTAHFSIGSGTKLALEDAIELARSIGQHPGDLAAALTHYEELRSVEVLKIQNAARNSTEWFEHVDRYVNLPPEQFAYSLLTRSQRISHENLRLRDKGYVEDYEDWIAVQAGVTREPMRHSIPPMLTPFTLRGVTLPNRVVVSPMAQYSCVDGMPGDYHLVHLGARAMGGAGLVVAEMTCPSPDARITPGCPGLWNEAQRDGWKRIVDFVHANSSREDRHAARPRRRERIDARALGRRGPAARERQLAAGLGVAAAVPRRRQRLVEGDDARRHGPRHGRLRPRDALRRRGRLRLARAALRARLPALVVHLAAHQPAHRRVRRLARQPAALSARGLRRGARRSGPKRCRSRCGSRRTTGSRAASRPTTRSRSRAPSRRRAPT